MASAVAIIFASASAYWIYSNITCLLKNIAAAKRTGLPYLVVPVNLYNPVWLITHKLWLQVAVLLPISLTESWLPFMLPDWTWDLLYEPFKTRGDVFLTVSPGCVNIWLANAEAIHQVTARREDFQKPLDTYRILEIFGRNIITTEGSEWKKHRRISSPGFNEKNNVLVFSEACSQAQGMLRKWTGPDGTGNTTLNEVPTDSMRLTLHIISRIGFGVRLLWPGEKPITNESARGAIYSSHEPTEGYTMSYEHSLDTLLENLLWVLLTPKWLLKHLPFNSASLAYESFDNWTHYMSDLFAQKVVEAREGKQSEGMDIMGSLVRSSYGKSEGTRASSPDQVEKGDSGKHRLSDSDILGNAFVMIVAGHETTANSIHFSLIELAINPKSQKMLQKEVQTIFGAEPPENWDYEANINALLGGMVGAVLNEQLRLMPPIIAIPKRISKSQDQVIVLDGKKITLPAGAHIALNTIAVHRNPRYWPTKISGLTGKDNDLDDFKPERWLTKTLPAAAQQLEHASEPESEDDFEGFTGQDSSAQLFRPVRGSYIPFSDGARSCLGRRLAQVKIMGILAVIFQNHSIELAVDEWASDEEVLKMNNEQKIALYKKAQEKAKKTIRGSTTLITLKLQSGFIPVRVVRKGEERFVSITGLG